MDKTRFIGAAFAALVVSLGSAANADHKETELFDTQVMPRVCSDALFSQGRSLDARRPAHDKGRYNSHGRHSTRSHNGHSNRHNDRHSSRRYSKNYRSLVGYHGNGTQSVRLGVKDGRLHGRMNCWYKNGVQAFKGNFRRGRLDGSVVQHHRNGAPLMRAYFRHGKPEGRMQRFFRNGQRAVHAYYRDGEFQGHVRRWHPNGQLAFAGTYDCGQLIGQARHYAAYPQPTHRIVTNRRGTHRTTEAYRTRRTYAQY